MASVKKLIQKMKDQPNGISYEEAARVLNANGYRFARQRGSHCHFINDGGDVISILHENTLKKVYVVNVLERIGEKKQ